MEQFYDTREEFINVDQYLLYHHLKKNIKIPKKYLEIYKVDNAYINSRTYLGYGIYTYGHWGLIFNNMIYEIEIYDQYLIHFSKNCLQLKLDNLIVTNITRDIIKKRNIENYELLVVNNQSSAIIKYDKT